MGAILNEYGEPFPSTRAGRKIRAKFDAAQTTESNIRHWVNADSCSADAAASPGVRHTLRIRGRYEQFNNPYMDGMLQTMAADAIGSGPRLNMLTRNIDIDDAIEAEFLEWCAAVGLAEKLRVMVESQAAVGEVFAVMRDNPQLDTPVTLDLVLFEPEQVANPNPLAATVSNESDGIIYDKWGNPKSYMVLKEHPGDMVQMQPMDYDLVAAEDMIHLFRPRRPGQRRGIPWTTSGLPLHAARRNLRASVLDAARAAAVMGAVTLETQDGSPDDDDPAGDTLPIDRGSMVFLPRGYAAKQMEAHQPGDNYGEFDRNLIDETARPLNIPSNIAQGNSSKYNYASGRLDYQTWERHIEVLRGDIERKVMDRLLRQWLRMAVQIPGYLPKARTVRPMLRKRIPHVWLWRGRGHVDPAREARAAEIRIKSYIDLLEDTWAKEGKDPETMWQKLEDQIERQRKLGIDFNNKTDKKALNPGTREIGDDTGTLDSGRMGSNGNGVLRGSAVGSARSS